VVEVIAESTALDITELADSIVEGIGAHAGSAIIRGRVASSAVRNTTSSTLSIAG
jgi:hypothetical protein